MVDSFTTKDTKIFTKDTKKKVLTNTHAKLRVLSASPLVSLVVKNSYRRSYEFYHKGFHKEHKQNFI